MASSCSPNNTFGPLSQVLFLGLTVENFSANAGWNEQASSVTVNLIYDPCTGTRKYCDTNLSYTSGSFSGDPGWNGASVGSPVFFKMESFEFSGIIQSYTRSESASGYPMYTVTLSSPTSLLEGTQVITDQYQGTVFGLPNIFNVYAFLESIPTDCPLYTDAGGTTFGSPSGGFGYSKRTDRGIPWYFIKRALQVLIGGAETSIYSPNGCVTYVSGVGTYGSISSNKYAIDITDLPDPQDQSIYDYRLDSSNYSILDIASQVCNDGGYDFFVDMLPVSGGFGGSISNIIKFRTVNRRSQPALNTISTFVNNSTNVISSKIGQELRPENNSAFLIGPKKRQFFEQYDSTFIMPYFGRDNEGNLNSAYKFQQWHVVLDMRKLKTILSTGSSLSDFVHVTETELRAVLKSKEAFVTTCAHPNSKTDLSTYLRDVLLINSGHVLFKKVALKTSAGAVTAGKTRSKGFDKNDPKSKDLDLLFNFLNSYADEFYMKKFLVGMPWVCYDTDTDTGQNTFSDLPSTEGAWISGTGMMGQQYPTTATDIFRDDMGKIHPVLYFQAPNALTPTDPISGLDVSNLSTDEYLKITGTGSLVDYIIKADIEEKWVTGNPDLYGVFSSGNDTACAVLSLNKRVEYKYTRPSLSSVSVEFTGVALDAVNTGTGTGAGYAPKVTAEPLDPKVLERSVIAQKGIEPVHAGVPVLSNTQTYGPWYGAATAVGKISMEQDDGLAPWEYGSFENLDYAAFSRISDSVTEQQTAENGSVTLAGYPAITLGTAIDGTPSVFGSRTLLSGTIDGFDYYYINVGGPSTASAQITSINIDAGANGMTTQYEISTFTPTYGRFSKGNADRLRINAANARKSQRNAFAKSRVQRSFRK